MPFAKGKSGNPKGRPPNSRALAELLRKHGNRKVEADGEKHAAKDLFAAKVWEGLTTGVISYPDVTVMRDKITKDKDGNETIETVPVQMPHRLALDSGDFISLAKLVLGHLDGPVNSSDTNINVNQGGGDVKANSATINIISRPARTEPPQIDFDADEDDDE